MVELEAGGTTALQIAGRAEVYEGATHTSARVVSRTHPVAGQIMPPTHANGSFVDGGGVRVEVRVKLPEGDSEGTWPAVWMLPTKPVRFRSFFIEPCCCSVSCTIMPSEVRLLFGNRIQQTVRPHGVRGLPDNAGCTANSTGPLMGCMQGTMVRAHM